MFINFWALEYSIIVNNHRERRKYLLGILIKNTPLKLKILVLYLIEKISNENQVTYKVKHLHLYMNSLVSIPILVCSQSLQVLLIGRNFIPIKKQLAEVQPGTIVILLTTDI
jgi:hypothetical protein